MLRPFTRLKSVFVASASLLALFTTTQASAQDADFMGLPGDFDWQNSVVYSMSGDGSIVVGVGQITGTIETQPYMWQDGQPVTLLANLPGATQGGFAIGISLDGTTIVGDSRLAGITQGVYWRNGAAPVSLGSLFGGGPVLAGRGANLDGSVIVGTAERSATSYEAMRWTESTGAIGLGHLGETYFSASHAMSVSADGAVIVGQSSFDEPGWQAFRWTEATGMVSLGSLAGGSNESAAVDISSNGEVIVGFAHTDLGYEAMRWTEAGGMVGLGDLPGGVSHSIAYSVSADGNVIVGLGNDDDGASAWRWMAGTGPYAGMHSIEDLLLASGVDIGEWDLRAATAVSEDGSIIAGGGVNPDGDIRPWKAVIGLGLIGIEDFHGSLASTSTGIYSAQNGLSGNISNILGTARHLNGRAASSLTPEIDGAMGIDFWGYLGQETFNPAYGGSDGLTGAIGVSGWITDDLSYGIGGRIGEIELGLPGENNESNRSEYGIDAYLGYEPKDIALRAYIAAVFNWTDDDLIRSYLNGATDVFSRGKREGFTHAGSLQLGWEVEGKKGCSWMPFASYEIGKLDLDPYAEEDGPFPAHFDAVEETYEIGRLGVEATKKIGDKAIVWGSAAWAHQFDDKAPYISGRVEALSSDFMLGGMEIEQDWAEFKTGVTVKAGERTRLNTSLSIASDFEESTNLGVSLGFSYRF